MRCIRARSTSVRTPWSCSSAACARSSGPRASMCERCAASDIASRMRPVMSKGTRSLRRAVLVRLLVPVTLVALLAAAIAYVGARHFSVAVLDQWLYDAARSMANRVRWDGAQARLELRPRTGSSVDTDVVDRYLYEITTDHGVRVAGNAALPSPPEPL